MHTPPEAAVASPFPVIVREYRRIRAGRVERVRRHARRRRRWFRRPRD